MTDNSEVRDRAYQKFLEEAPELLGTIEQNLFTLCAEPRDRHVRNIMRAAHTLKGAAAAVGLSAIVSVTHAFEEVVQCLYYPDLAIDLELFSCLLEAFDRLRCLVTAKKNQTNINKNQFLTETKRLFAQLQAKLGVYWDRQERLPVAQPGFDLVQAIFEVGIKKRLEALETLLANFSDVTEISNYLRLELEVFIGLADSLNLPGFSAIAKTSLTALEIRPEEALKLAHVTWENLKQGYAQVLAGDREWGGEPSEALLALAKGRNDPSETQPAEPSQLPTVRVNLENLKQLDRTVGELQIHHNYRSAEDERLQALLREAIASHQHQQTIERLHKRVATLSSSQPNSQNVSTYAELNLLTQKALAEMKHWQTTTESLAQMATNLHQVTQKQQRLLSDVQKNFLETLMLPVGEVLHRFPQTVKQLASVHLKPVQLKLDGTNVLVDRAIAEKLYALLLHLIRNAFDHGIETTKVRCQQGKPAIGQLEIRVEQQGWQTVIEVTDDGQGLDFDRIRDRAVDLNWYTPETANRLSRQQLSDLLFESGFSTCSTINELSGRGIGLETVKAEVEALNGTCSVRSEPYRGTTFSLRFPITLTIVKLTVVLAGERLYALLSDTIEKIFLLDNSPITLLRGKKVFSYSLDKDNFPIPVHNLSELIAYRSPLLRPLRQEDRQTNVSGYLLVLRDGEKRFALEVEGLLGEQKTAIKPLGSAIAPPSYVYGCSLLGQNRLALIIDAVVLVSSVGK
jgi:chemotaxis protein histidine kinase CheA